MANEDVPEQSSKTEDPSQKKLDDALKRGDVAKSQEVTNWFMLMGSGLTLLFVAPWTAQSLMTTMKGTIANADAIEIGGPGFASLISEMGGTIAGAALMLIAVLAVFALAGNLVQHRLVLSLEPITPRLSKISPVDGFRRLFSLEALVNFAKGLIKLAVVGAVLFFVLWPERTRLETMITADPAAILQTCEELGLKLFIAVVAALTIIAGGDYLYQRQRWWNRMKMTVQETRDEFKQMEGDPKIKARIRQIRLERGRRRMMAAVPNATVVITNPTHYAIALKYDRSMRAPQCLAKGTDAVALRIRTLAEEHDVPIVENPPLARALYKSIEIDQPIPVEHFKAVAQVIGYVMRLQEKRRWRA
jgi:flagellar biosynthetic protein FlhB